MRQDDEREHTNSESGRASGHQGSDACRNGPGEKWKSPCRCGISHLRDCGGAQDVYDALKNELKAQGMDYVLLEATGCVGICQFEPVVEVYIPHQPRTTYVHMTPDKAVRVVQQHLRGGNPLSEYTIGSVQ